jgi:tetratricopeptide (TPR) repeat protein
MNLRAALLWAERTSLALLCASSIACFSSGSVVRVVDGQEVSGRFVHPDAYALFMQGVVAEQTGRLAAAERFYLAAYRRDRQGVAILARLGAVRCAWGPSGYNAAERTFEEALSLDPAFSPVYLERARCALLRGAPAEAEADARRALGLAPKDSQISSVLAEALEHLGQREQAARLLHALALLGPSETAWRDVASLAARQGDAVRGHVAAVHARRVTGAPALGGVDDALVSGDLGLAQQLAHEAGMDPGSLATRAAALGQWKLAREQARMLLAAEPGHADAMAVWLCSPAPGHAYESVDPVIWGRLLRTDVEGETGPLSDLGFLLVADALGRRFGPEVAAIWLGARGVSPHVDADPLARALLRRIRTTVQRPSS